MALPHLQLTYTLGGVAVSMQNRSETALSWTERVQDCPVHPDLISLGM